jgi:hypothetical protein
MILSLSSKGKPVNLTDVGRELRYPLTDLAIVFAMLFYWLIFGLGQNAGLFGIALLFLTTPAYLRYLLYLLEARANGQSAPVPDISMFNPADNFWTLTPFIPIAVAIWAGILLLNKISLFAVFMIGASTLVILPASMAVLAITHSPVESLNPFAMARMIRACGSAYFSVPITQLALLWLFYMLYMSDVPLFWIDLGTSYQIMLIFSMTGAVLKQNDVAMRVDIPDAIPITAEERAEDLDNERQKVANHAYGFISRDNREGGFAHIRQWLENETARDEAYQWFFLEMLKWESREPALFFAQDYLGNLLRWGMEKEALKLIARCLHENPRWKPAQADRHEVTELVTRHGRDDLIRLLSN